MTDAERDEAMRALEPSESAADLEARQKMMAEEKAKLVALLQAERNPKAASSDDVVGLVAECRKQAKRLRNNTYREQRDALNRAAAALERLPAQPRGDGDAVREVLGFTAATLEQHARYNLEGVLHDIKRDTAFMTRDGGVCAGTIERVIEQLAKVEIALSPVSVEGEQEQGDGDCASRTVAGRASPRASDESRPSGDHQLSEGETR